MFQTFSGNSRRPRNVNLSGQTRNPFSLAQTSKPTSLGGQDAVAQAQQERRARQLERDRQLAAKLLQRNWRGHFDRRRARELCRSKWDEGRQGMPEGDITPDAAASELRRAQMLAWFAVPRDGNDAERVAISQQWLSAHPECLDRSRREWKLPLLKMAKFCLARIDICVAEGAVEKAGPMVELVALISREYPDAIAAMGTAFYAPIGRLAAELQPTHTAIQNALAPTLLAPLLHESEHAEHALEGLVLGFLTVPALDQHMDLTRLAPIAREQRLSRCLRRMLAAKPSPIWKIRPDKATPANTRLLYLMAYFIQIQSSARPDETSYAYDIDFVYVISSFLSRLGNDIGQKSDFNDSAEASPLPPYIDENIMSLISQESISQLSTRSDLTSVSSGGDAEDAAIVASYALTLLQVFPRKADEIRLWLYMSSTKALDHSSRSEPAIKYFWKAVTSSHVYQRVRQSPRYAVELIKRGRSTRADAESRDHADQEWRLILLFLELYTFVLRIMDDDEFMAGGQSTSESQSRTRQSALDLSQVRDLTVFLKNFAFTMYWNADDIAQRKEEPRTDNLATYFGRTERAPQDEPAMPTDDAEVPAFAGVEGMTMSYMKGMATGLLRALYDRDSRRNFCPTDHWLMQDIELNGFIEAVVMEQAFRDKQDDDQEESEDTEMWDDDSPGLVGTSRTQQIRRLERLRQQQSKATRHKMLRDMTPRLEILQNMPFFIPFTTRVEIFHHFVLGDQTQRRNGFVDPDQWRMSLESSLNPGRRRHSGREQLTRHSAKVRRDHVFDDAFEQFYQLGDGLKEPIQITFVDQFGTAEAGIDGGGVTKEFLTSVASEAFSPDGGLGLFVENDQHLLYPNPSALDEQRTLLREAGVGEGSADWNAAVRELLQRYEFLGRVVGKCLYEGILVDVNFAPFFLVKWALTGGDGAAAKESNYRATLNDLRDLDERLYQGLLQLKNYEGDVEDFALDFTSADVVARAGPGRAEELVETRELVRGGAARAVTNANRLIYISAVARHRLQTQPAAQTAAFLRGLAALVPPGWLSMFNRRELQTLLAGTQTEIDVADLRANTLYGGIYAIGDDGREHPTVQLFWSVLEEMRDDQRRKLLGYVTSTPRAPLLGFSRLNPRFSIRDSGSDQARLPSTSTCVNLLKLPVYKDRRVLREKLEYAINAGAGFNLS